MISMHRFFLLPALAFGLASCQSTQHNNDPYASAAGGGYNPYPDQGGYASNAAPSYSTPPAPAPAPTPPPPSDPYAYNTPKTTSSSSSKPKSTAGTSTKKKTTTASSSSAKKKSSSSGKRYTVKQGDTLYGIARKNGTSVAKIKSANGLSSDMIRPGQTLKIP